MEYYARHHLQFDEITQGLCLGIIQRLGTNQLVFLEDYRTGTYDPTLVKACTLVLIS